MALPDDISQRAVELATELHKWALGNGQSLDARDQLPRTPEAFADAVVRTVLDALAGGLHQLNESIAPPGYRRATENDLPDMTVRPGYDLTRCRRCRTRHGREDQPPIDWAPLADAEGRRVAVVCPGCREIVMSDPLPGLTVVQPVREVPSSGVTGDPGRVETIRPVPPPDDGPPAGD